MYFLNLLLRFRFIKRYISEVSYYRNFYFHLIQIRLKEINFNFIKNINLINDFDLLKI